MTPKRTRTLDLSPAATFAHILPLELIANSTFATIIFTLKGHVCPPLPPLGKGKEGACPSAPPLSGVPGKSNDQTLYLTIVFKSNSLLFKL